MSDTQPLSYFQQRMQALGIIDAKLKLLPDYANPRYVYTDMFTIPVPGLNLIELAVTETIGEKKGEVVLKPYPIFTESEAGIAIMPYTLDRSMRLYSKASTGAKNASKMNSQIYKITRFEKPLIKTDKKTGEVTVIKYLIPKGQNTMPFFAPELIRKYEAKEKIETLYFTEGYFKGFKACMHGLDCVAFPSITCMRDKDTNEIHEDIKRLILKCQVERVVWLIDGDCLNLTTKELDESTDLYKRPQSFFSTINKFFDLFSGMEWLFRYFAHINTFDLGNPELKGIDDILCGLPEEIPAIVHEFKSFNLAEANGIWHGRYISRVNISHNIMRVNRYFRLNNVDDFYLFHSERRTELKDIKTFKFHGTSYKYDEESGKCVIVIPKNASDYIRVGDNYYQHFEFPDKMDVIRKGFERRLKSTIQDDHGKNIFEHIQKFHKFVVVPSHTNYQQIKHGCWNRYNPFIYEPEQGDCTYTLDFIKHIFGSEPVTMHNDDGTTAQIPRYEIGLDYITLLYKNPQHILPVLCLVSRERQTGKTSFANWLDELFTGNTIFIGNEDMQQDFNSHWVPKLLIFCDETKIDKHEVIQKVKRLSTASKIVMNTKGVDQTEMEFFAKFILMSNEVDNFITIDREENRFWIIEVPTLERIDQNFKEKLHDRDQINAFLYFLEQRKMVTTYKERHWFDTRLLQTCALQRVKENSVRGLEKRIRIEIEQLFDMMPEGTDRLTLPLDYIQLLSGHKDKTYVKRTLNEMGYKTAGSTSITYPVTEKITGGDMGREAYIENKLRTHKYRGKYYEFFRNDFTTELGIKPENTAGTIDFDDKPFT